MLQSVVRKAVGKGKFLCQWLIIYIQFLKRRLSWRTESFCQRKGVPVCVCVSTDARGCTHIWWCNLNYQISSAEIGTGKRVVDVERILEFQSFDFPLYLYNKKFGKTPGLWRPQLKKPLQQIFPMGDREGGGENIGIYRSRNTWNSPGSNLKGYITIQMKEMERVIKKKSRRNRDKW